MADSIEWLTRSEAAERLGVSPQTLDRYVRNGSIARYKIAGSRLTRFRVEDVNQLFRRVRDDK